MLVVPNVKLHNNAKMKPFHKYSSKSYNAGCIISQPLTMTSGGSICYQMVSEQKAVNYLRISMLYALNHAIRNSVLSSDVTVCPHLLLYLFMLKSNSKTKV